MVVVVVVVVVVIVWSGGCGCDNVFFLLRGSSVCLLAD
jgi:hypothetical protein